MLNRSVWIISFLLVLAQMGFAAPVSLYDAKDSLTQYYRGGEYEKAQVAILNRVKHDIKKTLKTLDKKQKPTVILDIDDTALSYVDFFIKNKYCYDYKGLINVFKQADAPANKAVLAFYKWALAHDIKVVFVTGRRESLREPTALNLKNAGYTKWDKLFLKPNDYNLGSNVSYKVNTRKSLENDGYAIVANIGDQKSDITGGHAMGHYLLPNPYYKTH